MVQGTVCRKALCFARHCVVKALCGEGTVCCKALCGARHSVDKALCVARPCVVQGTVWCKELCGEGTLW